MPDTRFCMAISAASILRVSEKELWAQLISNTLSYVNRLGARVARLFT